MQKLETACSEIWLDGEFIVQKVKRYAVLNGTTAEAMVAAQVELGGIGRHTLVDIREPASVEVGARRYFASKACADLVGRVALLQGSFVTALAANLFMRVDRPIAPVRMFTDEAAARDWLGAAVREPAS